ncbi:hypothetical protein TNCT_739141 [Trichonephila clavata]|uniref:Uncharacterized protein n=1 Tax=Trichonephila clavata TaxID=2740835 RepID=A0A8X6L2P5_TRICU|nr:hypothetical protein TNCT_739141 [Trichonephila clavata]
MSGTVCPIKYKHSPAVINSYTKLDMISFSRKPERVLFSNWANRKACVTINSSNLVIWQPSQLQSSNWRPFGMRSVTYIRLKRGLRKVVQLQVLINYDWYRKEYGKTCWLGQG